MWVERVDHRGIGEEEQGVVEDPRLAVRVGDRDPDHSGGVLRCGEGSLRGAQHLPARDLLAADEQGAATDEAGAGDGDLEASLYRARRRVDRGDVWTRDRLAGGLVDVEASDQDVGPAVGVGHRDIDGAVRQRRRDQRDVLVGRDLRPRHHFPVQEDDRSSLEVAAAQRQRRSTALRTLRGDGLEQLGAEGLVSRRLVIEEARGQLALALIGVSDDHVRGACHPRGSDRGQPAAVDEVDLGGLGVAEQHLHALLEARPGDGNDRAAARGSGRWTQRVDQRSDARPGRCRVSAGVRLHGHVVIPGIGALIGSRVAGIFARAADCNRSEQKGQSPDQCGRPTHAFSVLWSDHPRRLYRTTAYSKQA